MTTQVGAVSALVAAGFGLALGEPPSSAPGAAVARAAVPASIAAESTLAFVHVNVVDVATGRVGRDQAVVIAGPRITAVGAVGRVAVPAGARRVDARGLYLIPGLWDMHNHVGAMALPAEQSAVMRNAHLLLVANGITGIRDAGTSVPLDSLLAWRRAILAGTRVGPPRQLLAGRSLEEQNGVAEWTHLLEVPTPAAARHAVDSLLAAGADYIKVHDISSPLHDSVVADLRRRGVLFGGHLDTTDLGGRFLDHGFGGLNGTCRHEGATVARCRQLAAWLRRHDMWFVASPLPLGGGHVALSLAWQRLPTAPPAVLLPLLLDEVLGAMPDWSGSRDSLATTPGWTWQLLDRGGIPLLLGTDNGYHGRGAMVGPPTQWWASARLHDGLAGLVQRGMSPRAALQAVTLNPARALHATDSLGTAAAGKLADLVLLAGDPLVDIRNTARIRGVVANGRYFDRAALDSLLASVDYAVEFHMH